MPTFNEKKYYFKDGNVISLCFKDYIMSEGRNCSADMSESNFSK